MNLLLRILVACITLATSAHAGPKVIAYIPNWIDLEAFSSTIPYAKLTHINIAFENPDEQGHLSFHAKDRFVIRKAIENKVKVLVSIGGGAASESANMRGRYRDLLEDNRRAAFADHLAAYVVEHEFDGIDVDLEGPAIDANYVNFIHDLATRLQPKGKLLTAALSKGYGGDRVPDAVFKDLDLLNNMAYDATGNWNANKPGQHSSREFAKDCVTYWLDRGVPASKAVLGLPFYGYGFGKDYRADDGYAYRDIVEKHPDAELSDKVGDTIWYNGISTIEFKTKFAISKQLAGVMIWSLDQDADGKKSLLNAIDGVVRGRNQQSESSLDN